MDIITYLSEKTRKNTTDTQLSIDAIARRRAALHSILKQDDPILPKFDAELDAIDPYSLSVQQVSERLDALHIDIIAVLETDLRAIRSCLAAPDRAAKDRAKQQRQAARETLKTEQFEARENAERERLNRLEAARLEGIAARQREIAEKSIKIAAQREAQRREAEQRKAERERQKQARLHEFRTRLKRCSLALNGA